MERQLQDKLQEYSAVPPAGVWQRVADALDEEGKFSRRLYHFETQPPAAAWQTIEKTLEQADPAPVIPFTTRFRRPLQYAAVASLLAVIAVSLTLIVNRPEAGAPETASNRAVSSQQPIVPDPTSPIIAPAGTAENSANTNEAPPQQSDIHPERNRIEKAGRSTAGRNPTISKSGRAHYASLNDYVFFSDGDGKMRKVSKKMADFVNCKDNDIRCQQRLQQLRRKMAANAMTTDFTGILEMMRQLQ